MMRRSRRLAAAAFLLLFIFGVQNVSTRNIPELKGTPLEPGCYHFYGRVDCQNGGRILPSAEVVLWFTLVKRDNPTAKGEISTAKVDENGDYSINGCVFDVDDDVLVNLELNLEFNNVCFDGQLYVVSNPKPYTFESYLLVEEENTDTGNDENDMILSNRPMSRPQHRRFEYYPMPPPYNHRLHDQQQAYNDFMNIDDAGKTLSKRYANSCRIRYTVFTRGEYTFKGTIKCGEPNPSRSMAGKVTIFDDNVLDIDYPLGTSTIKENGEYEMTVYAEDTVVLHWFNPIVHIYSLVNKRANLYFKFENICADGDLYEFGCLHPGFPQDLRILNGEVLE